METSEYPNEKLTLLANDMSERQIFFDSKRKWSVQNQPESFVRVVDVMGTDKSVTDAARVSYSGGGTKMIRKDIDLLRYLMRHQHYSPFAMCQVKLHLRMPLFVRDQLIRHDRFHWNIMSARYSEMPEERWQLHMHNIRAQGSDRNKQVGDGLLPQDLSERAEESYIFATQTARESYEELLRLGVCREQARAILPASQYTEAYVTATLGDWLQLLSQRVAPGAQQETRELAKTIEQCIFFFFPETLRAFWDYQRLAQSFSRLELHYLADMLTEDAVNELKEKKDPPEGMSVNEFKEFKDKISLLRNR